MTDVLAPRSAAGALGSRTGMSAASGGTRTAAGGPAVPPSGAEAFPDPLDDAGGPPLHDPTSIARPWSPAPVPSGAGKPASLPDRPRPVDEPDDHGAARPLPAAPVAMEPVADTAIPGAAMPRSTSRDDGDAAMPGGIGGGPVWLERAPAADHGMALDRPSAAPVMPEASGKDAGAPTIRVGAPAHGYIAELSTGFPYASTSADPGLIEETPLAPEHWNGIDPGNVRLDARREVSVIFEGESAGKVSALGVYRMGADGAFENVRILFPVADGAEIGGGRAPVILHPGYATPLGRLAPDTQIGFFLVTGEGEANPVRDFAEGRFELRRPGPDAPAEMADGPSPRLVRIGRNGEATPVEGNVLLALNPAELPGGGGPGPAPPSNVVSWFDDERGDLVLALEDAPGGDGDHNDAVFRLHYGAANEQPILYAPRQGGGFDIDIRRAEGGKLGGATLKLTRFQDGDRLELTGFRDADGDGVLDGTSIHVDQPSARKLVLSGDDGVRQYEAVLNAVRLRGGPDPEAGERRASLTVTDRDGDRSGPATIRIEVEDRRRYGTDGPDRHLDGGARVDVIDGGKGKDRLSGGRGGDILNGGDGDDQLFGGPGPDILIGGPGMDRMEGGAGADRFVVTSLGDGRDTIDFFNPAEGDRLDLARLLEGAGLDPHADDISQLLTLEPAGGRDFRVIADLDGPGAQHMPAHVVTLVSTARMGPDTTIEDIAILGGSNGATS